VVACLDARLGEVYHAAYERDAEGWREVIGPGLYAPQRAPMVAGDGWTGCGSGFAAHGEALRERYANQLQGVVSDTFPHARDIAKLAAPLFARGEGRDAALAAPLYIRNKVALKTSER
jgi:tRNA threonylcarbamoyladenosine biosynthesis protein TsaB